MKINIEEIQKLTAADGLLPYAAVCHFRRQALFPIQETAWKVGETELICLHGGSYIGYVSLCEIVVLPWEADFTPKMEQLAPCR